LTGNPYAVLHTFVPFKQRVCSFNYIQLDEVKERILFWISSNGAYQRYKLQDLSLVECNPASLGK
jgi:hypothetical protein